MEAKLTLKFDKSAIEDLKAYAKRNGTSVSRLVENYAKEIGKKKNIENLAEEPTPEWLKNLRQLRAQHPNIIDSNEDLEEDYRNYISKKHK